MRSHPSVPERETIDTSRDSEKRMIDVKPG